MKLLDRSTPPHQHPITELQLPAPRMETLENGIPVYTLPNPQLDLIHILIHIRSGILHETQKHLSQFTYALLKESSNKHSSTEIADLLDFYGVHYTTSCGMDKNVITISVPRNNVSDILPTIYDFIAHPEYKEDRLDIYANLKIKDLEYNSQKTDVRSTQLMLHAMFGDSLTAGQFSTRENLKAVTVAQMQENHQRTFCAENLRIFITGNVDADMEQCIKDLFAQVPHGHVAKEIRDLTLPVDSSPLISETMPDSVQSSITLCCPNIGYLDADRRGFSILGTITGGYFGSRLMQNLRERNGYTYGVSGGSVYFGNQSLFIINSDVNAIHTQAAVDACFEELQRLQEEPVCDEELETARNYILGDMLRDVDNSVSYLKKYAYWNQYGLNEREFQDMIQAVKEISADVLLSLAKKYFDYNNFTRIIVGDIRNLKQAAK